MSFDWKNRCRYRCRCTCRCRYRHNYAETFTFDRLTFKEGRKCPHGYFNSKFLTCFSSQQLYAGFKAGDLGAPVMSTNFGRRCLHILFAVWPQTNLLTSLCLSVLICKMGKMTVHLYGRLLWELNHEVKTQWNSSWHVATALEAFTSAIIIRVENNILRCSFMFPSPQQRIHGLNAGLVPGSSLRTTLLMTAWMWRSGSLFWSSSSVDWDTFLLHLIPSFVDRRGLLMEFLCSSELGQESNNFKQSKLQRAGKGLVVLWFPGFK